MSKKGYGNLHPRFAKYFARHKNSAGAHDPKNAKQQELAAQKLTELSQEMGLYDAPPEEVFDVNEHVKVISGAYEGERGRIVIRRQDKGDFSYGIVFPWDVSMIPHYVSGDQIERDNEEV